MHSSLVGGAAMYVGGAAIYVGGAASLVGGAGTYCSLVGLGGAAMCSTGAWKGGFGRGRNQTEECEEVKRREEGQGHFPLRRGWGQGREVDEEG